MKTKTMFWIILVGLLLGSLLLLAFQDGALAQAAQTTAPPVQYSVAPGAASGEGYRLTGTTWQVSGAPGGGKYRLLTTTRPTGSGTPCCCLHFPCLAK